VTVIFSEDLRTDSGRMLERQILARVPDARVIYVDSRSAAGMSADTLAAVDAAEQVVVAVYAIPTAGRAMAMSAGSNSSVVKADANATLLNAILEHAGPRTAVLAMGNPYLAQDFPSVQNYLCTFSNATVSEVAAVKALFGEIPTHGHLPVTIPGIASRGAGLEHPALNSSGGSSHAQQ
jgi:beta-N-acetylhexosaminidase